MPVLFLIEIMGRQDFLSFLWPPGFGICLLCSVSSCRCFCPRRLTILARTTILHTDHFSCQRSRGCPCPIASAPTYRLWSFDRSLDPKERSLFPFPNVIHQLPLRLLRFSKHLLSSPSFLCFEIFVPPPPNGKVRFVFRRLVSSSLAWLLDFRYKVPPLGSPTLRVCEGPSMLRALRGSGAVTVSLSSLLFACVCCFTFVQLAVRGPCFVNTAIANSLPSPAMSNHRNHLTSLPSCFFLDPLFPHFYILFFLHSPHVLTSPSLLLLSPLQPLFPSILPLTFSRLTHPFQDFYGCTHPLRPNNPV